MVFMDKFYMTEVTPPEWQQALHSSNDRGHKKEADLFSLTPHDCVSLDLMFSSVLPSSLFILHCLSVFVVVVSPLHLFHCTTDYLQMSALQSFEVLTLLNFTVLSMFSSFFFCLSIFSVSAPPSVSLSASYSSTFC